jgi:hypothetical protein
LNEEGGEAPLNFIMWSVQTWKSLDQNFLYDSNILYCVSRDSLCLQNMRSFYLVIRSCCAVLTVLKHWAVMQQPGSIPALPQPRQTLPGPRWVATWNCSRGPGKKCIKSYSCKEEKENTRVNHTEYCLFHRILLIAPVNLTCGPLLLVWNCIRDMQKRFFFWDS